jgi:uncharacterized protein DUF3943
LTVGHDYLVKFEARALAPLVVVIAVALGGQPCAAADLPDVPFEHAGEERDAPLAIPQPLARGMPATDPDWPGLVRDMAFLVGYQVVSVGVIYLLPESVSNWTSEQKDASGSEWLDNIKRPQWDNDGWFVNYVGHPYVGAIYYTRARERGFSKGGAFVFSAVASAAYEFGVEALFERPSYQDLIVTPVAGALLGAFVFEPIRASLKSKPDRRWYEDAALFVTDPLGAMNGALERLLGIKSELRVSPRAPAGGDGTPTGVSVELRIPLW